MNIAAMKQALEHLDLIFAKSQALTRARDVLHEAIEQAEQAQPVDSVEKANSYMEARLWEFIDIAAAWPKAKPNPRTWSHLMVYAPQRQSLTEEEIKRFVQKAMKYYGYDPDKYGKTTSAGFYVLARGIEAAHGIKGGA